MTEQQIKIFLIIVAILMLVKYTYTYLKLSNIGYEFTDFSVIMQESLYGNKPYEVLETIANLLFRSAVIFMLAEKNEFINSLL